MNGASTVRRYRDTRRRLLVDMHIGDWDERFLSRYDPGALADVAEAIGAEGVMLYFQSHLGLCYYPTHAGVRHRAAAQRDLAGEALQSLRERHIPVCAYYSVNFNNWAWLDHPDWRLDPAAPAAAGMLPRERYGIVCLNNFEYRALVDAQIAEIAAYAPDAFFFDMVWWNGVCICPACRSRYRDENGAEIPERIDWASSAWTDFQAARERWLAEFAVALRRRARDGQPQADVYHNFALGLSNWTRGVSFDSVAGHDFLGGDFYGGRAEQMLITRLMLNLTPNRPAEFMTTVATGLTEHVGLRPTSLIRTKALAALAADSAFLAIAAIDPDGSLDAEAVGRIAAAFEATRPYDAFTGGRPIEEVGVYCSDFSKGDAAEAGRPIGEAPAASAPDYPHFHTLLGACRILQQAHIPFGVVSRMNLGDLRSWPVLVLPNVERMSPEEVAAFRDYVRVGGRLYASRGTSLRLVDGGPVSDFTLADVFGCRFEGEEQGRLVYASVKGKRPLAHWRAADRRTGAVRIRGDGGQAIAKLTLPYGYPHPGSVSDSQWASIHSSPPWEETDRPLIARNAFGAGVSIYSAIDIEAGGTPEHDALFLSLVRDLLPRPPRIEADTHPYVWLSGFEQPGRIAVHLLNYQTDDPPLPIPRVTVRVQVPEGRRCSAVRRAPDLEAVAHSEPEPGQIEFEAGPLDLFALYLVEWNDVG